MYSSSCTLHLFQFSHNSSLLICPSSDGHPVQFLLYNEFFWTLIKSPPPTHTHTNTQDSLTFFQSWFSLLNFESFGLSLGSIIQGISQTTVQLSVLCESSTFSTASVDGPRVPRIAGCRNFKVARIRNRRQKTPYGMKLRVCICNLVPFPISFGNLTKHDRISTRVTVRLMSVIPQKMSRMFVSGNAFTAWPTDIQP